MGQTITEHCSQQNEILSKSQICQVVFGQGIIISTKICILLLCICQSKITVMNACCRVKPGRFPKENKPRSTEKNYIFFFFFVGGHCSIFCKSFCTMSQVLLAGCPLPAVNRACWCQGVNMNTFFLIGVLTN